MLIEGYPFDTSTLKRHFLRKKPIVVVYYYVQMDNCMGFVSIYRFDFVKS